MRRQRHARQRSIAPSRFSIALCAFSSALNLVRFLSLDIRTVQLQPLSLPSLELHLGIRGDEDHVPALYVNAIAAVLGADGSLSVGDDTQTRSLDRAVSRGFRRRQGEAEDGELVDWRVVELCVGCEGGRLEELGVRWGRGVGEHGDEGWYVPEFWSETGSNDIV
jgi:hypothetical protein